MYRSNVCIVLLRSQLHLHMDSLRFTSDIGAANQRREAEVAQAIAKAQKEEMDLIKSHFTINVSMKVGLHSCIDIDISLH